MKISICISTYNGITFFEEQINSILKQTYTNYEIFIRDDGSTDEHFIELLKKYASNNKKISVFYQQNLGVTQSFFKLLEKCPPDTDLVVFADQDDVWYDTRLESTVNFLKDKDNTLPLLSFCRIEYVDESLNHINYSPVIKHAGLNNALVQNVATGCSITINNLALSLLLRYIPTKAVVHDWWFYLVISAMGKVYQEPNICIKYRQHSNNVLGGVTSFLPQNKKRLKKKLHKWIYKAYEQDREFYSFYENQISVKNQSYIKRFLRTSDSLYYRLIFLFDFKSIRREKLFDNVVLKLIILFARQNPSN